MKTKTLLIILLLLGAMTPALSSCSMDGEMDKTKSFEHQSMDMKRSAFIAQKDAIIQEMKDDENYRCCLEIPCTYCIEKSPGHGEGAQCHCLKDVMEGVHPCGECIGEAMEGHANKFIAEYFPRAIAEKVGEQHKPALDKIFSDMYDIPVEDMV
tara:strand:- start:6249 stop:6710 length:462 start_codon:yes stop_codon:yes gene_type:complete